MMSRTHITVGVASALALSGPSTPAGILSAVIGGCAGGILCDIECKSRPEMRDALYGRLIAVGISGMALLMDAISNAGICISILFQDEFSLILGVLVLLITGFIGRRSDHRTFTHSLFFVILISFGFFCITEYLLIPTFIGGISHLVIDTFNKKPVPWLYPLRKKVFVLIFAMLAKPGILF